MVKEIFLVHDMHQQVGIDDYEQNLKLIIGLYSIHHQEERHIVLVKLMSL